MLAEYSPAHAPLSHRPMTDEAPDTPPHDTAAAELGLLQSLSLRHQREFLRGWAQRRDMTFIEPKRSRGGDAFEIVDRVGFRMLPVPKRHDESLVLPVAHTGQARRTVHRVTGERGGVPLELRFISYRETSDGGDMETFHYLVVVVTLLPPVAARFVATHLYPWHNASTQRWFSARRNPQWDVELESAAFNDRFRLKASPQQDPIAVRELFSPVLIERCLEWLDTWSHQPFWEQVGEQLGFIVPGHPFADRALDDAVTYALTVAGEYLREAR